MIDVDLIGAERAIATLDHAERVLINPAMYVADQVFDVIETAQVSHFAALHGRYVDTGELRESLTSRHAANALRLAHGDQIDFGTLEGKYQGTGPLALDAKLNAAIAATILREVVSGASGN